MATSQATHDIEIDFESTEPTNLNVASDRLRRSELADFLRRRREGITPEQIGLSPGGRRRTPGLRREEVAQQAGVGVTWYTWLEQARDIKVSEQVLDALSRALLLDPHERAHLFTLAGAPSVVTMTECDGLDPAINLMLERFGSYPAAVINGRYDILAYNPSYVALVGDLESLPFDQRNTLWLMFTSPRFMDLMVDRENATRRMVAQFRAAFADHMSEPAWRSTVKRLQNVSQEFCDFWDEHNVAPTENFIKRVLHPEIGLLNFRATSMWLRRGLSGRMVVYTPADEATEIAHLKLSGVTPRPLYEETADPAA
jgi:transcriptional regulator with XRE-family HTH domain